MKQNLWFSIYDKLAIMKIDIEVGFEKLFLNKPSPSRYGESYKDQESLLHANYDKLLYVLGSFTALLWLNKFIHPVGSIIIVLLLCILKTIWNYKASDDPYNPAGDWLANLIGFSLWILWEIC